MSTGNEIHFTGRSLAATQPIFESTLKALIRKVPRDSGYWQVFQPFTDELWVGVVTGTFVAALIMIMMEYFLSGSMSAQTAVKAVYHAWVAVLGSDDFEWSHRAG